MSIEYFVEGKVITQTEGDNISLSKEDISHNSTQFVNQQGADTGVSYNTPKNIHPNDKPVNTIDVSLNLFFDGTMNNKTNTETGTTREKKEGSYANDYSNVARGYDAIDSTAENQVSWYIEGIGTVDGETDNDTFGLPARGGGMGIGERGIKAKVTKGCLRGADALKNKFGGKEINILKINVFGFSRGAAAARHFVHVASTPVTPIRTAGGKYTIFPPERYERNDKEKETKTDSIQNIELEDITNPLFINHGYFGACLVKAGLKIHQIQFNFIGLYDTVASFGANHRGNWFVGNDSEQLNLNAVRQGAFIFQIASDDEFRENFSLTNIKDSGIKGLQITLPGVHSDIGGGYVNGDEEKVLIYEEKDEIRNCENYRSILIDEGWFLPDDIFIEKIVKPSRFDVTYQYQLWGKRILSNHYDKIPLDYMFQYSKQFDTKYLDHKLVKNKIEDEHILKISSQLFPYINTCNSLRNDYVRNSNNGRSAAASDYIATVNHYYYRNFNINIDDLKTLRSQFLHWSANLDSFGMKPRVSGVHRETERKRTILNG